MVRILWYAKSVDHVAGAVEKLGKYKESYKLKWTQVYSNQQFVELTESVT